MIETKKITPLCNVTNYQRGELDIIEVRNRDNIFRLSRFGGQLLGWEKEGTPILFENNQSAITDGKTAYRGGAPICAPYFGKGLLLPNKTIVEPQHGNARKSVWDCLNIDDANAIHFTTTHASAPGYNETNFRLTVSYDFSKQSDIEINCSIKNIGTEEAPAQFVIHCYWETTDPSKTIVSGLGGSYLDNLDKLSLKEHESPFPTLFHPPFDRVYPKSDKNLEVISDKYQLTIKTENCGGSVLWNPGTQHGLKDLLEPTFVCVESGVISPAPVLKPEENFTFQISFNAQLLS
jgi:glucose-6-phosphate 1-epimerase